MARKSRSKKKGGLSPPTQTTRAPEARTEPTIWPTKGFTLADEARQTGQQDHSFWSQATKLRLMPISFISAGTSEPLKAQQYTESNKHQNNTILTTTAPKVDIETDQHRNEETRCSAEPGPGAMPSSGPENTLFHLDTSRCSPGLNQTRNEASTTQTQKQAITDTERSDSEGEIILFKGRLNIKNDAIDMETIRTEIHVVEQQIEREVDNVTKKKRRGRRGGKQAKAKRAVIDAEDEDDGMLADYIANMRENDELRGLLQTTVVTVETNGQSEGSEGSEGSEDSSDDDNDAAEYPAEAIITTQLKQHTPGPGWTSGESGRDYTDFDLMDWERPSLRQRKSKGAKQKLDLRFADLDPETERRLQAAWHSDRLRKAGRKKEREQLRAMDWIGNDTEDLRIKYAKGISLQQIADELQKFLMGIDDSICLPPMDKHARKLIHELANTFNVKSKSIGKADQRRPTLHRTKRTPKFDEEVFDLAIRRIQRRYFPRLDYKGKSSRRQFSRNGYAEASYRDGEIVGASAPELSMENRGRAILEKMGWSTGTALGSADNKGILLPVTQTMKRSKAGLG